MEPRNNINPPARELDWNLATSSCKFNTIGDMTPTTGSIETCRSGWIKASLDNNSYDYQGMDPQKGGKWIIRFDKRDKRIDKAWNRTIDCVRKGLFYETKVSVFWPQGDEPKIVIYVRDYEDLNDVRRVHKILEEHGILQPKNVADFKTEAKTQQAKKEYLYTSKNMLRRRCFNLKNNLLFSGYRGDSHEIAKKMCGTVGINYYLIGGHNNLVIRPKFNVKGRDYAPLTNGQRAQFFAGRAIRFLVAVPGTILDAIFQVVETIFSVIELFALKLESKIRGLHPDLCFIMKAMKNRVTISDLLEAIRNHTTAKEPVILARAIGVIGPYDNLESLSDRIRTVLVRILF